MCQERSKFKGQRSNRMCQERLARCSQGATKRFDLRSHLLALSLFRTPAAQRADEQVSGLGFRVWGLVFGV